MKCWYISLEIYVLHSCRMEETVTARQQSADTGGKKEFVELLFLC
jgi:hypothetical protein